MIMKYWWNNTDLELNTGLRGEKPATYRLNYITAVSCNIFYPVAQQSLFGQGVLIIAASRSYSDTPHSVGLLWTSDQSDAKTST